MYLINSYSTVEEIHAESNRNADNNESNHAIIELCTHSVKI